MRKQKLHQVNPSQVQYRISVFYFLVSLYNWLMHIGTECICSENGLQCQIMKIQKHFLK